MPGPLGVLDKLTLEQEDELYTLYETHPAHVVLQKIAAPPPEGWGIVTHITSLRRFYQRKQLEYIRSDQLSAADMAVSDAETEALQKVARAAIVRHICQVTLSASADSKAIQTATRQLVDLERLDAKREQRQLLRDKLELERAKAQFNAIFKASSADSALRGEELHQVLLQLKEAVKPGGLLNPKTFRGFGPFGGSRIELI